MYETKCGIDTYDGTGFYSKRGSSGQMKHRYLLEGEFCFSTGPVDTNGNIKFKQGKVIVKGLKQSVCDIKVKVKGE